MTELHVATGGPLVKELVADVLAEFDVWAKHAATQAAAIHPNDIVAAANSALYDVRTEIGEHVQIRLAITLAAHGLPT